MTPPTAQLHRHVWRVLFALLLLVSPVARAAEAPAAAPATVMAAKPGPWGRIEYQFIYLTAPDAILDEFPTPNPQPRWSFADTTPAVARTLLTAAGVADALRDRLFADPRAKRDTDGVFTLFPAVADIASLSPAVRGALYRELAKHPQNSFHHEPTWVPDGDVDAWLRGTGLPDHIVALVREHVWKDGDATLFSDYTALISHAGSDAEARRWVKVLTRTRAVVAHLKVDAATDDLTPLRRYWSAGYQRRDSLPMLNAAAETPGGSRLDLTHLLPPLPRRLTYAYTTPELERAGQAPNCHWTSLNFFSYTPQTIWLDLKLAASKVIEDYDRINGPPTFGDILFFLDEKGNAFHSVVYLADELVFSKNGGNTAMPWIITRLGDVKQLYLHGKPSAGIITFRRRWPGEGN
jgi:hypothetical protein